MSVWSRPKIVIPKEEFAKGTIEALERAAQATLHVAIKVRTESAGTTKVKVDLRSCKRPSKSGRPCSA